MAHPAPATLYLYSNPNYQVPEPEDVRAVIRILDLTADQVGDLIGVKDGRAVRRWLAPPASKTHAKIDYATWRLLLLEAGLVRLQKRRPKSGKTLRNPKDARSERPKTGTEENAKEAGLEVPEE